MGIELKLASIYQQVKMSVAHNDWAELFFHCKLFLLKMLTDPRLLQHCGLCLLEGHKVNIDLGVFTTVLIKSVILNGHHTSLLYNFN